MRRAAPCVACVASFWAIALAIGTAAVSDSPAINEISPTSGSTGGGTRLSIHGSGFSGDHYLAVDVVHVGPYPCTVVPHLSTAVLITCITSPGLPGTYPVNVTVASRTGAGAGAGDGAAAGAAGGSTRLWGFEYRSDATPMLQAVVPSAGPPGSKLRLVGNPTPAIEADCQPQPWGGVEGCLGDVRVGPWLCVPPEGDTQAAVGLGPSARWSGPTGGDVFAVNCSTVNPVRNNPQIPLVNRLGTAGFFNVTLGFEGSSAGAPAVPQRHIWRYTPDGQPYMYEIYPVVHSVDPPAGSVAGGTLLTIRGRGFPDLSRSPNDTVTVTLPGGGTCSVVSSTHDTITCLTDPKPSDTAVSTDTGIFQSSDSSRTPVFPGMRGAWYDVYNKAKSDTPGLWRLNRTSDPNGITVERFPGSYSTVLYDKAEGPESEKEMQYACSKLTTFFEAPQTADYSFYMIAGEYGSLYGSWFDSRTGANVARMLVSSSGRTLDWWEQGTPEGANNRLTASSPVQLVAGQAILLEANRCSGPQPGTLQVGVRMSSATPAANSMGQLQRLSVRVGTLDTKPASVSLKLLYGRSEDHVIAVQIRIRSSIGAAAFANPRLGLALTVNGTETSLAVASTAEEMKNAIANALGGGWKSNANVQQYLGVRRMLESGGTGGTSVLLVEIGAATSGSVTSGVSSLNIANARLVQLPGPNIAARTNTSSCRFANPLAAPVVGSAAMEAFLRPSDPDVDFPGPLTNLATLIQTGKLQVDDVTAAPVPREVAALAGTWQLSLSNGTGALQLPYDAAAERVGQAVSALTGLQPSEVIVNDDVRQGAYRARVWKVTFDGVYNYAAPLVMTAGPGLPAGILLAVEPNPGASWMYGKVRVSRGDYCEYVDFDPLNDPIEIIRAKLASLPGVAPPALITRATPDKVTSAYLLIQRDGLADPGDTPPLKIVDTRGIRTSGSEATTVLQLGLERRGMTDMLFAPIPANMLRLPVPTRGSIRLSVNGVNAACSSPEGAGSCAFAYDQSLTPSITEVRPTSLSLAAGAAAPELEVWGNGFAPSAANGASIADAAAGAVVTLGGVACRVLQAEAGYIRCSLSPGLPAGRHQLTVRVAGRGDAAGAPQVLVDSLGVTRVQPAAAGTRGFTLVTLSGSGFAPAEEVAAAAGGSTATAMQQGSSAGSTAAATAKDCTQRLRVTIAGRPCAVVTCSATNLTVLFQGGSASSNPGVSVEVLDTDGSSLLTHRVSAAFSITESAPSVVSVAAPGFLAPTGGTTISVMLSAASGPLSSAISDVFLIPSLPEAITASASGPNGTATSLSPAESLAKRFPCSVDTGIISTTADGQLQVPCTLPPSPVGNYSVGVLLSSGQLLASLRTLQLDMWVSGVEPPAGSAGGGATLFISGGGFPRSTEDLVVFLSVPRSATYPTGRVPCTQTTVSDGEVTCVIPPYVAVNGTLEDPQAEQPPTPAATPPLEVVLAVCPGADNGAAAAVVEECLADPSLLVARCRGTCTFSYSLDATPVVGYVTPSSGPPGTPITIVGRSLAGTVLARFDRFGAPPGANPSYCSPDPAPAPAPGLAALACTVPDELTAGNYTITLIKPGGDESIDPYTAAFFAVQLMLAAVSPPRSSLAGGSIIRLTTTGDEFDSSAFSPERVSIFLLLPGWPSLSLPCPVASVPSTNQLTCTSPPLTGWAVAELWSLAPSTSSLPAIEGFASPPHATALLETTSLSLPDTLDLLPASSRSMVWGGRLTWYLQVASAGQAVISFPAGSSALMRLRLNGAAADTVPSGSGVGSGATNVTLTLPAGVHKFMLTFFQGSGLRLPTGNPLGGYPWAKAMPVRPGSVLPVQLTVNGARAEASCAGATVQLLMATGQTVIGTEPEVVTLSPGAGACAVVYSTYQTPTLVHGVEGAPAGVVPPTFSAPLATNPEAWTMTLHGSFLTQRPTADVRVTVGGQPCAVQQYQASATVPNGGRDDPGNGANYGRLACVVPPLPAGSWPVEVAVVGYGNARLPPTASYDVSVVPYTLAVLNPAVWPPSSASRGADCQVSLFGGGTITVSGSGFVDGLARPDLNRTMSIAWESPANGQCSSSPSTLCVFSGAPSPPLAAINLHPNGSDPDVHMPLRLLSSNGTHATYSLGRYTLDQLIQSNFSTFSAQYPGAGTASPAAQSIYLGMSGLRTVLKWRLRVTSGSSSTTNTANTTSGSDGAATAGGATELEEEATGSVAFCVGRTPLLGSTPQPNYVPPQTNSQRVNVAWLLTQAGNGGELINTTRTNGPSTTTVEFETAGGGYTATCSSPTITYSSFNVPQYGEYLACTLPPYMPAATYTMWVCREPIGCGYYDNFTVGPLAATGFGLGTPTIIPTSGGVPIRVVSSGHSLDPSHITARFCEHRCAVTSADEFGFSCTTQPGAANATGTTGAFRMTRCPLTLTAVPGASEITFPSVALSFDPGLDVRIDIVVPTYGPADGGTMLTIRGNGFLAPGVTVEIGSQPCAAVNLVSNTILRCLTAAGPSPEDSDAAGSPLPITVVIPSRSVTHTSSNVTFTYARRWSRPDTWPMGRPPAEGEDVVVQAGAAVLLDVSPPPIGVITVLGQLLWDFSKPSVELQARAVLVDGGGVVQAGQQSAPYPGRATLTLYGDLDDPDDLPLYGSKVLAVRDGAVRLYGMPKDPPHARLAATASPGDRVLLVSGPLSGWAVGDVVVVSSSSLWADEVDEAAIVTISPQQADPTVLRIELDRPLSYTHLGETVQPPSGGGGGAAAAALDLRAVVAVLSRSVVVQGSPGSEEALHGARVHVQPPSGAAPGASSLQLSHVELRHMGQPVRHRDGAGPPGYSFTWVQHGQVSDTARASWLEGCVVHHSHARAVTMLASYGVRVRRTVSYAVYGHAFALETGGETGHVWDGNAAVLTLASPALARGDAAPAAFLVTHPNNNVTSNIVAGTDHSGIWYRLGDAPSAPYSPSPSSPLPPSASLCPKYSPLPAGAFASNTVYGARLYGMRLHPEYVPLAGPACPVVGSGGTVSLRSPLAHAAAAFEGLVAAKNGLTGLTATQVGLVRFRSCVLGDNGGLADEGEEQDGGQGGGRPLLSSVAEEVGAQAEVVWTVDDRSRLDLPLTDMAGLQSCTLYGRTAQGAIGTAGRWPATRRRVAGVATHSPPPHLPAFPTAPLSLVDLVFVNYTGRAVVNPHSGTWQQHYALEPCARCVPGQGGATTVTRGLRFLDPGPGTETDADSEAGQGGSATASGGDTPRPALTFWSWAHQGVYEDSDGSLLSPATLPPILPPLPPGLPLPTATAGANMSVGGGVPGAFWLSGVDNEAWDNATCVRLEGPMGLPVTNNGLLCAPAAGPFRRVVVTPTAPPDLATYDMWLVEVAANRSSRVRAPAAGSASYGNFVAVLPADTGVQRREYWMHWTAAGGARTDPESLTIKYAEPIDAAATMSLTTRFAITRDTVSLTTSNGQPVPPAIATAVYDDTLVPDGGWRWRSYSNASALQPLPSSVLSYSDSALKVNIPGSSPAGFDVHTTPCTPSSSNPLCIDSWYPQSSSAREPFLRWSSPATWAQRPGGKPVTGDDVTVPYGWRLLLDESPPPLGSLVVAGGLAFDPSQDVTLTAGAVVVTGRGSLSAGSASSPHPTLARLLLTGSRSSTPPAAAAAEGLGGKLLAVLKGGTLDLHGLPGQQVTGAGAGPRRWTRLSAAASPGDTALRLAEAPGALPGWAPGSRVLVSATSYNQYQAEVRYVVAVLPAEDGGTTLVLDDPLRHPHGARTASYPGGYVMQLAAEVALASSNVVVAAAEAYDSSTVSSPDIDVAWYDTPYGSPDYWASLGRLANGIGSGNSSSNSSAKAEPWDRLYGARVLVSGPSTARLSNVVVEYCGQAGVGVGPSVPCIRYDSIRGVQVPGSSAVAPNPSYLRHSAILYSAGSSVDIMGTATGNGVELNSNVLYGAYGAANVLVATYGNTVRQNLALGAVMPTPGAAAANDSSNAAVPAAETADMSTNGTASVNITTADLPTPVAANFHIITPDNWVDANVAAGSDRYGFLLHGMPCRSPTRSTYPRQQYPTPGFPSVPSTPMPPPSPSLPPGASAPPPSSSSPPAYPPPLHPSNPPTAPLPPGIPPLQGSDIPEEPYSWPQGSFEANTAHGCLAGLWLRSSAPSRSVGCTQLAAFTAHTNWDYGLVTARGIDTDVRLYDVRLLDNRHAGAHVMRLGAAFTEPASVLWRGGLLAGRTSPDVCGMCVNARTDPGCPQRLAAGSYNGPMGPSGPRLGLVAATFALGFTLGPEADPWDSVRGYPLVYGSMQVAGVTLADFAGPDACSHVGAPGAYAFANNPRAPDAAHPHAFANMITSNVQLFGARQGLFWLSAPDPAWRNPTDCGTAVYRAQPNTAAALPLNCAGPARSFFVDLDGSLTLLPPSSGSSSSNGGSGAWQQQTNGAPAVVVGAFTDTPPSRVAAQGPPLPNDTACVFAPQLRAYVCALNTTGTGAGVGGSPVSGVGGAGAGGGGFGGSLVTAYPAGLPVDLQPFVMAARDADNEVRTSDTVAVTVGNTTDVIVPTMDQSWCFDVSAAADNSSCSRRLAAYWTYLPAGRVVNISWAAGKAPRSLQIWMPSLTDTAQELLLLIHYPPGSAALRHTWLPGQGFRPHPEPAPPAIGDGSLHGAYYWDPMAAVLYVKMRGGAPNEDLPGVTVELRTEPTAMVGLSLALPMGDWNATAQQQALSGLAAAAELLPVQLHAARAVAGSVVLDVLLSPDPLLAAGGGPAHWPRLAGPGDTLDAETQAQLRSATASLSTAGQLQRLTSAQAATRAAAGQDPSVLGAVPRNPPPPSAPPTAPPDAQPTGFPDFLLQELLRVFIVAAAPNTTDALGSPSLDMPRLLAAYDYNGDNVLPNDAIQTAISAVLAEAIAGLPSPPPPPDQPPSPPTPPPAAPGPQTPSSITSPPVPAVPPGQNVTDGTTPWAPWAQPDSPPAPDSPRGGVAAAGGSGKGSSQLVVILAVVLGAVVALGLLAVLYVMLKRRRRQKQEEEEEEEEQGDSKESAEEAAPSEEVEEEDAKEGDEDGSSELCCEPHTRTHSQSSVQHSDASTVARSSQSGTQPRDPRRSPASRLLRSLSGRSNAVAPEPPALVSPTASVTEVAAAAATAAATAAVTSPTAAASATSPRSPGGSGLDAAAHERRFSGRRATSSFRALDVPPELDPIPESQEVDVQGPVPPRLASPPAGRRAQASGPTDADQQESAPEGEQAPTVQVAPAGAFKQGRANGSKKPSFVVRQVAPEPLPLGAQEAGAGVAVGFAPLSKSKGKGGTKSGGEQHEKDPWSASKRWGWKSSRSMSGKVHAVDGSESGSGEAGEDEGQEEGYGSGGRGGERSSGASRNARHKGREGLDDDNVSSPRGGGGSSANTSLHSRGGGGGRTSLGAAASPPPSDRMDSGSRGRRAGESSGGRHRPWSGGSGSRVVPEDVAEYGSSGRMSGSGRAGGTSRPWSGGSRGQVVPVNAEVVRGRKRTEEDGEEPVGSGARARPWSGGSGNRVAPEPDDSRVTRIHISGGDSPGGFTWARSRTGGSKKLLRATTSLRSRGGPGGDDLGALPGVVCIEDELEDLEDGSEGAPPHADKYDRSSAPAGSVAGPAGTGSSGLVMGMKPGMGMRFISLPKLGANLPLPPLPEPSPGVRGMSRTTSLGAGGWMKPEASPAPLTTATISGGQAQLPPYSSRLPDSSPQGTSAGAESSQQQQPSLQGLAGSTWAATRSTSMQLLGSGSGLLGGSWGALGSRTVPGTDLPAPGPVLHYATSMGPALGRQHSSGFGAVGGGGSGARLGSPPERLVLGSPPGGAGTGTGGPRAPAPTKSWRLRLGSDGGGGSDA